MRLQKLLLCVIVLFFGLAFAQLPKDPSFVISVTPWERRYGIWGTSWIQAQQNTQLPPMYYVCGIAFQEMIWKKNMSSGCPSSCSYTLQTFKSMVNGVKVTYCRYNDWNKQIIKTFETTNKTQNNGVYRQYKCPRDTFATKVASKFGFEYETDLGLNGIQLVCQNINLNGNQTKIEDPSKPNYIAPLQSSPKYGFFISSVIFKYEVDGKICGVNFGYSGVPVIWKMVFEYGLTSDTFIKKVYESEQAENQGSSSMQIMKDVNKSLATDNTYTNQNPATYEYDIDKNGIIEQYEFLDGMLLPDAKREISLSNFSFNSIIQSRKQISQHICIQVGPCKKVEILTEVNLNKAKTVYTVVFTFNNRLTGQLIGVSGKIKGGWTGTLVESVKSKSIESNAEGCAQVTNNLTTQ